MSNRGLDIDSANNIQVNLGDGVTNYNIYVQTPEEAAAIKTALSEGKGLESLDIRGAVHNLPFARNICFTGREGVLERIAAVFGQPETVAITQPQAIHGLGGIGKSQIAVEHAYRHLNEYRYVFWIEAESEATLYKSFRQLAVILGLPASQEKEKDILMSAVRSWIENREGWLLIFDNAEDVASVQPYLPRNQTGRTIITTRSPVMGGIAQAIEVDEMEPSSAVEFLLKRANISENETETAGEVCRLLSYLPLAIDHAGAYIETTGCSLDTYRKYLEDYGVSILSGKKYTSAMYGKTVSATWAISVDKLKETNPSAVELLAAAAHLAPDDIPMKLFIAGHESLPSSLSDIVRDGPRFDEALGDLQRYSLIRRRQGESTFSMHRLVQSVIRDSQHEQESMDILVGLLGCLEASTPDVKDYRNWPVLGGLLPHANSLFIEADNRKVESETLSWLLDSFAFYLEDMADYGEAEPLYLRALKISEKALGPDHPDVAACLNNLAHLYCVQGRYVEAEPLFLRSLKIAEKTLAPDHPDVAIRINNLAGLYCDQGRHSEAELLYLRSSKISEKALGPDHPDLAIDLNNLAELYHDQGRYGEAEPLCLRALKISEKALRPDHPQVTSCLSNLAVLYNSQGRYGEAEPLHLQALKISEKTLGPDHPDVANHLNNLAALYFYQGRYGEAEPLYLRALTICQSKLGKSHSRTVTLLEDLTLFYQKWGKKKKAREYSRLAEQIKSQE